MLTETDNNLFMGARIFIGVASGMSGGSIAHCRTMASIGPADTVWMVAGVPLEYLGSENNC